MCVLTLYWVTESDFRFVFTNKAPDFSSTILKNTGALSSPRRVYVSLRYGVPYMGTTFVNAGVYTALGNKHPNWSDVFIVIKYHSKTVYY